MPRAHVATKRLAVVAVALALVSGACGDDGGQAGGRRRAEGGEAAWRQIDSFDVSGTVQSVAVGEEADVEFEGDDEQGAEVTADQPGAMSVQLESPPGDLVSECGLEGGRARIFWTTTTTFDGEVLSALEGGLEGRKITAKGTYFLRVGEGAEDAEEKCQLLASEIGEPA
ncbi:MAG: hypothetical protein ACRDKJ_08795 [Actinomycetota bacterium]